VSLTQLTATKLLEKLSAVELTAVEATTAYLDAIEARDAQIGAFLSVRRSEALQTAEEIDARRAAGKPVGKLAGLPVAVKDVLCFRGEPTTCASRILENFHPPYSATVIEKLQAADAVILGKTNLDEFAMGGSCEKGSLAGRPRGRKAVAAR